MWIKNKTVSLSMPWCSFSYLRKLQASSGERQWSTQVGRLNMEQRLGSRAVGPPPLIITILWICSGYSWARKVQNDTLGKQDRRQVTGQTGGNKSKRCFWGWERLKTHKYTLIHCLRGVYIMMMILKGNPVIYNWRMLSLNLPIRMSYENIPLACISLED